MFRLEPKIDLLHDLLGYGPYAEIYCDGHVFLGRRHGDVGFNDFLGRPSEAALQRTTGLLLRMSEPNRKAALEVLGRYGLRWSCTFTVIDQDKG